MPTSAGAHRHVFNAEQNLNADDDDDFSDSVSSIVMISGNWQFFRNWNFDDDYPSILSRPLQGSSPACAVRGDNCQDLRRRLGAARNNRRPADNPLRFPSSIAKGLTCILTDGERSEKSWRVCSLQVLPMDWAEWPHSSFSSKDTQ